jgi:hypothetical protein
MPMKVTQIETHHIKDLGYHDWCDHSIRHYANQPERTVYVCHTDNGLEGIGEASGPPAAQDRHAPRAELSHFEHFRPPRGLGPCTFL